MITCKRCNTENLDGSQYCDECGAILTSGARARKPDTEPTGGGEAPIGSPGADNPSLAAPAAAAGGALPEASGVVVPDTRSSVPEPLMAARSNAIEAANTAIKSSAGTTSSYDAGKFETGKKDGSDSAHSERRKRSAAESGSSRSSGSVARRPDNSGAAHQGAHAKLIIHRGRSVGKEFLLNEDEAHIGRWDADGGIFPDVDLDSDDPEAKVSRRHARITRRAGQYYIEDLGSTNGTFINRGRRLLPGDRQPLRDGDEVIVGKTFLRFQVIK